MVHVAPFLYVGNLEELQRREYLDADPSCKRWSILHAAKEPFHRDYVGYSGRAAPKDHPEYLFARRQHRLALNLIDAPDPNYIPKEVVDAGLAFIGAELASGRSVFVHCNQGESRAPSLALLFMAQQKIIPGETFEEAREAFEDIYPDYNPGEGMAGFLSEHWSEYVTLRTP